MARFRKGTNDHDGDGSKGGSLKTGSRFVPGTNDADNNGRKGGSLPKGDTAMAKKSATRTAATTRGDKAPEAQPTPAKKREAAAEQFATADETTAAEARLRLAVRGF